VDARRASAGGAGRALVVAVLAAGALIALPTACARQRPVVTGSELSRVERWWIVIGASHFLESADWRHHSRDTQMVVLSGDSPVPLGQLPPDTIRLAYLSVGETEAQSSTWRAVKDQSFIVEPNPNWPGNMRVDIRDERWQQLLLRQEVPRLLTMGFDGLMLDTLDTVPYLENKDPSRFAGSRRALADWLRALRRAAPRAIIVANGTEALIDAAPFVDGFIVEGVFAMYDFGRRVYRETTDDERAWKLGVVSRARSVAPRPVFSIEYADIGDIQLGRWAADQATKHGFRPYVSVKDLNVLP
jgi:uncharacterized protein (TIGR01370 family)